MNFKRVVITGLGTINPLGHNVAEFWENLKGGVSGAGPITRFDASKFRTQFACEVKNYEPTEYFDKKEVRKMDLYSQFALICSREAVKDAGLDFSQEDRKRIGVIWGAGIGGFMGVPIALLVIVTIANCNGYFKWIDNVPALFIGAGAYFCIMSYIAPTAAAPYTGDYVSFALVELFYCVFGLVFGWITIGLQGICDKAFAKKMDAAA